MSQFIEQVMEEEDTQSGKYLTFSVGKENYGIGIRYVTEIIGIQEITELPRLPEYIKGIINLRGKIIPVLDMRVRFGKDATAYTDRTCIIIIDIRDIPIGLIVDSVSDVLFIPEKDIVDPPNVQIGFRNKYVMGIGKVDDNVKLLLDCEKLLREGEEGLLEDVI